MSAATDDPHAVEIFHCPIHGPFEDLAVAAPGWCPKCDAKMPPAVEVAEAQGFTIDRHTYPWVAYTGARFSPLVAFKISTPAWPPT